MGDPRRNRIPLTVLSLSVAVLAGCSTAAASTAKASSSTGATVTVPLWRGSDELSLHVTPRADPQS